MYYRRRYKTRLDINPILMKGTEMEIKNAIIKEANIFIEEHGLLTVEIVLDCGKGKQNFGGWSLYSPKSTNTFYGSAAGHFIWRVMEIADVRFWDRLEGKAIRVKCEHKKIHAIGHIVKDNWFDPNKDFRESEAEGE